MAAVTRIQDIINPEVLTDQVNASFPDKMVLGNSDLVVVDTTVPLGSPGSEFKMPAFNRIADFGDMSEGVALVTTGIDTRAEFATVLRGGGAYATYDTSRLVSLADPYSAIVEQLSQKAARYIDGKLVTELIKTPNTYDQTGNETTGFLTPNAITHALVNTIGDNFMDMLSGGKIIIHSKVYGDLISLGVIQNQYQSGMDVLKTGVVGMVGGLGIIISDLVTKATVSSVVKYQSYIVAPGALALFYQRNVQVEFDRDTLSKEDVISADVHFAPHLFGYDDKTSAVKAQDNKSIHVVNIKTN